MIELSESKIYEFEDFRLDVKSRRLLWRESKEIVQLTPKAIELLIYFAENAGRVLLKDEILENVWENSFVEESNLSQTIFVLRKTLGEDTKNPRFILTVPNRGYQFIAEVKQFRPEDEILEKSLLSEIPHLTSSELPVPSSKTKNQIPKTKIILFALPLVLLIAFGIYWFYPKSKPATVNEIKTVAILPFEDLSEGQTEKYLGISLTDALANKFSELKQLTVRPTRTVLKYAESREDLSKIGRELRVDAVLDGRIQRIGERVRVNVQLVRTTDGVAIWSDIFDDKFTNFFAVQDSLSQKVVQSLALQMNDKERERFNRRGTENAEAYQDYLRGRYFWNKRTAENLNKAITNFEKAVQKDANFALAYTGLADCYILLSEYHAATPREIFPKAKAAINKALELDGESAEAFAALGYTQAFYDWDFAGAEKSFKRALELNPNYATAHQWYGEFISAFGLFDEARKHHERAAEIDPVSPIVISAMAGLYDYRGDYENTIRQAQKMLEIDPNFAYGYFYLAMGFERKGMDAEAAEATAKTMIFFGEPPEAAEEIREAFKKNGMKGLWQKRLEQVENRPYLKNFQSYFKALIQIRLGDKEGTLQSLNRAFEERDHNLIYMKNDLRLASLRDDSRFQDLLRRIGF